MYLWCSTLLDVFSAGLTQYSGDPRTEWHLNAHPTKASLLHAIANLPHKGGNTMTGDFLTALLGSPHRNVSN